MDTYDKPHQPRHRRNNPSFSSSLLDAIYRSIDESDGNLTGGAANPVTITSTPLAVTRLHPASLSRDSSSSDTDTARIFRPKPIRTGPILTRSERIRSDPAPSQPNINKSPISIKKKLRDLKKSSLSSSSSSPSSPGAKLAGFINSLFTASSHKKAKISTAAAAESPLPSPSNCSSASSYSRSCLSKTPSTRGSGRSKRSVRFCPVGVIVGEDCRPCGEKVVVAVGETAAERRRREVEEMLRGFESGDESDGSEDLFELENLGGRFRDELPVYETTNLGMNRAIAKGLAV